VGTPLLAADRHREGLVLEDRRRRERLSLFVASRLESGRVDERLEQGSGLAMRLGRAVELARGVAAPAHHREDLAGVGTQRDEAALEPRSLVLAHHLGAVALELVEPARERLLRLLLQESVEGRHDAQALLGELFGLVAEREILVDLVDEERSAASAAEAARNGGLALHGLIGFLFRDPPLLQHLADDEVLPRGGAVGVRDRVVERGGRG
jgi:hypothetical protein